MNKTMKILCVCRSGMCRSVATRHCLNERGYKNVIAIGWNNTLEETLKMLCDWADKILVAKPYHGHMLPSGKEKIDQGFTIGEDTWLNPFNKVLHKIINIQLDLIGL